MISLNEENILMHLTGETKEAIIKALVCNLVESGHVSKEYYVDVIEREKRYPTGLPTQPVGVAIPHANSEHVYKSGLCLGILKYPVDFVNMADEQQIVKVKLVFLLANKNFDDQLKDLEMLMAVFSSEKLVSEICEIKDPKVLIEKIYDYKNQIGCE